MARAVDPVGRHLPFKLGKKPARPGAVKFKLANCVWAGAAHETMLWNKEAARTITFNDQSVLKDYSAVTGFNPNDPNTDQGTDMQVAASYRRKTGVHDAAGAAINAVRRGWKHLLLPQEPR